MRTKIFITLFFLSLTLAYSQTKYMYVEEDEKNYSIKKTSETFPSTEFGEKRFALVVAVSSYQNGNNLPNNTNDANDMTAELNKAGFDVMLVNYSPSKVELLTALEDARSYYLKYGYNIALVYFTGHGAQIGGANLLMPRDAVFSLKMDNQLIFQQFLDKCVLLSDLVSPFDIPQTKYAISIVDACRSYDYIVQQKSVPSITDLDFLNRLNRDNEKTEMKGKNAVFFPVASGSPSNANAPNGRNSFFTYYFLNALKKKPHEIRDLQDLVIEEMSSTEQTPVFRGGIHIYKFKFYKNNNIISNITTLIDTDKDGFEDNMDECPTVYGKISGCPDADDDGIIDSKDKCPKEKGTVSNNGCPLNTTSLIYKTFTETNGAIYSGYTLNDLKHGQGTFIWVNGDKYVGEWKDNKRNGQGTYTWVNGNKYIGEWKDDKRNGQGTFIWVNGDKYIGEWKDDKMNGQGTYTWVNGNKYIGEWKDDKINGQGTLTWADGKKYIGEWKNDKMNGQGTYTTGSNYELKNCTNGVKFVGEYENNLKYYGKVYDKYGTLLYDGYFIDDKPIGTYPIKKDETIITITPSPPVKTAEESKFELDLAIARIYFGNAKWQDAYNKYTTIINTYPNNKFEEEDLYNFAIMNYPNLNCTVNSNIVFAISILRLSAQNGYKKAQETCTNLGITW